MKLVIYCILLLFSFISHASIVQKNIKCSRSGTDLILVNGISYDEAVVKDIMKNLIKPSIPANYVDGKRPIAVGNFLFSYNHTNGFLKDLLESSVQKISQNFNISADDAFVAAYYFAYKGVLASDFISSIYTNKKISFTLIYNFLLSSLTSNTLDKMIQDSTNANVSDILDLKKNISSTLLSGKKLILISESQGNFFVNSAIRDFQNGELLNNGVKTGRFDDFKDYIGQVQISPTTRSLLEKNRVVLNDKDVINLIFFDRPDPTYNYFQVPDNDPRGIDHYFNHMITSTYLNDWDVKNGDLPALKDFTLQSVVNVASLLESNCLQAVINYTKRNLSVNFDSTDPQYPNITGLTYSWNFGDGQTANTASKTFSHTYSVAGTYNVSLTVTDAYGASDTASASVIVQSAVGNLVICNGGLVQISMSFSIDSILGFSLDNIKHFDTSGPDPIYLGSTCECKKVNIPEGQSVGIQVIGSNSSDGLYPINIDLLPYNGFITAQPGIQYFTVAFKIIGNKAYYEMYKGVAYSTSCQEYVYK